MILSSISFSLVLPELPLPTPLPQTVQNKSLLYHPKLAEDAKKYLNSRDDAVIQQLTHALKQTSTEHMYVNIISIRVLLTDNTIV